MSASDIVGYHPPGITRDHHHAWDTFFTALTRDGYTPEEAGQLAGIAPATQAKWFKHFRDIQLAAQADRRAREPADDTAPPKREEELCPQARKALDDFTYFRARYLGRRHTPWQEMAAHQMREWLESPDEEFVVVNCPPASGKSTLFAHDIPLWLLCRNRALRMMIGSRTERQAAQYAARIRRTLMTRIPPDGAEATLMHDFGSFRPVERDIWRRGDFIVAQPGTVDYGEKESTCNSYGFDSAFLGGRFDLVIWDDLVDRHVLRSTDAREAMQAWFGDEAETRLEPNGLFVLQGQRLASDDLYRYALNLKLESGDAKYRHVKFPAHDETRCEAHHGRDAPYWPEGCLLDPIRVPWRTLAAKKLASLPRYRTVYQQEDLEAGGALVHPTWIEGGDISGHTYRGAWDPRRAGSYPFVDSAHTVSYAGIDPSPTRDWGVYHAVYDPCTEERHVIDLFRGPMSLSDLLDLNWSTDEYSGLMNTWQLRSEAAGFPIQTWIVEVNAAQRFVLDQRAVQRWGAKHRTSLIPHTTSSRKRDPDYGPQILAPLFEQGLVRLPGLSRDRMISLVEDVTSWTPESSFTFDSLMAMWFTEVVLPNLAPSGGGYQKWAPSWLNGSRAWVAS